MSETKRRFALTTTPGISDAASRWLAGERWDEAVPRRASTVMLVRDGATGPEVFMLRRVSEMEFAPSMMVFPGGGVDERDGELGLPWAGPSPAEWADRLGCSPAEAQMYVAAAIREVLEECGVLLASPSASGPLAFVGGPEWAEIRRGLVERRLSLADVLHDKGLVLRSDLIVAKAHWLTPVFEPRRYDTWFFAAVMPPFQVADGDTSEADHADWFVPSELLEAYAAGSALMLPPTVMCVEEIRDAPSAAAVVVHSESLPLIMPEVVDGPDGAAMEIVERWAEQ
ncbi:NUDIX hydrolase [Terrabacter sp. C0L_2]|uniref:NUDIX hydrolase n=1 Tax=Terrabacter sp. C0L_2 TaxID=3108389 RepID=UPI002ED3A0E0|nr:NUDIX hydrolase [Terrabacter sp. C0L_2]